MAEFRGRELLYNAAVHFEAERRFEGNIMEVVRDFTDLCWILGEMSRQHEAWAKQNGYEVKEPLKSTDLFVNMKPKEIPDATKAAVKAIMEGLEIDVAEPKERDLVLEELQKKTENE